MAGEGHPERRDHGIGPCDGCTDGGVVPHVGRHNRQLRVRDGEFAWMSGHGDHGVPGGQRASDGESARWPVGSEDDRLHRSLPNLSQLVIITVHDDYARCQTECKETEAALHGAGSTVS